ncbi:MAG: GHMP kinase [Flavobacteriales bacterium]|nr:GHMP kinase [Flavobacteriales bacterium]MBL6869770.1 GHMP kinase [Flavobacteriales bacterium]
MKYFHSNGKLLISGEYLVLDGALSLALPCKFGQYLNFTEDSNGTLEWISKDMNDIIWFTAYFEAKTLKVLETSNYNTVKWVKKILEFCNKNSLTNKSLEGKIECKLEFPNNWGLGSSSTLLNNLASLYEINPYDLHFSTTNGSGYDIACAGSNSALTYQVIENIPQVKKMDWSPVFKDEILFIFLKKKQKSNLEVKRFKELKKDPDLISRISSITKEIIYSKTIEEFEHLLDEHEAITGQYIQSETVKSKYFSDYEGSVKSLGAWGGDFVLATRKNKNYFLDKGFDTILSFSEIIKESTFKTVS